MARFYNFAGNWCKKGLIGGTMLGTSWCAITDIFYDIKAVDGISMQPTLNPKGNENVDLVVLDRLSAVKQEYERGDIVTLVSPKNPSIVLIKRVIATEGDRLTYGYFNEVIDIPKGHVWVEGDNTKDSSDSNEFGPVSAGLITAKVSRLVWPPERFWKKLESWPVDNERLTKREEVQRGKMFFGWDKAWEE